jgi:hypothetical protein
MKQHPFPVSALIAGLAMGLVSTLPLLNMVNCLLCVFEWLGGALAVFLFRRATAGEPALTGKLGAKLGALAGLFGAVTGLIVYPLTSFLSMPLFSGLAAQLKMADQMPFTDTTLASVVSTTLVLFVLNLILYPGFGAAGGAIAGSVWGKKTKA